MEVYDKRLKNNENDMYEKDVKNAKFIYVIDPKQRSNRYGVN